MERVLFCSGEQLIVYDWTRSRFGKACAFAADASGYSAFEQYLRASPRQPLHLLIDLGEEVFHPANVPHAWGRDRAAVLARAAQRHFRDSEWCTTQVQGRQKSGRRDLQVLVHGLVESGALSAWTAILQRVRVPVIGVYSLPLMGQSLLAALNLTRGWVLLVSQQTSTHWRQSFYDNGLLKLSRLVQHRMVGDHGIGDVGTIEADIGNTVLYLHSQRLLNRDQSLDVCLLPCDTLCESFSAGRRAGSRLNYRIFRQCEVTRQIGVHGALPTQYGDGVFAHILLRKAVRTKHYAMPALTRFYRYHLARGILLATAGLVLLLGGVFALDKYLQVQLLHRHTNAFSVEKARYRGHVLGNTAHSHPLPPEAIKSAVETVELLRDRAQATPLRMLSELATVLTRHPSMRISRVRWQAPAGDTGDPGVTSIHGQVVGFADHYRHALEQFERFIADLRQSDHYRAVGVDKTPFDVNPQTGLSGDSGYLSASSTFALRLTSKHNPQRAGLVSGDGSRSVRATESMLRSARY